MGRWLRRAHGRRGEQGVGGRRERGLRPRGCGAEQMFTHGGGAREAPAGRPAELGSAWDTSVCWPLLGAGSLGYPDPQQHLTAAFAACLKCLNISLGFFEQEVAGKKRCPPTALLTVLTLKQLQKMEREKTNLQNQLTDFEERVEAMTSHLKNVRQEFSFTQVNWPPGRAVTDTQAALRSEHLSVVGVPAWQLCRSSSGLSSGTFTRNTTQTVASSDGS